MTLEQVCAALNQQCVAWLEALRGWLGPRTRAVIEPSDGRIGGAPLSACGQSTPVMTKWVAPPWPELPCVNERTNASLWATTAEAMQSRELVSMLPEPMKPFISLLAA